MKDYKNFLPDLRFIFRPSFSKSTTCYIRGSFIPDFFIGLKFYLYNGRSLRYLVIRDGHIFNKAGSFFFTKRTGSAIHSIKSKKSGRK